MTRFTSISPRRLILSVICACALPWLIPVSASSADGPSYIPLEEISPGMTGYGLTVFEGTRIDTFAVTVVGVQPDVRAGGSLLIVEVGGHGLELSNIAQGMSGSPIYLDGRFAGALAFGWGGALRPIAGVTPAADMLSLPTRAAVVGPAAETRAVLPDLRTLIPADQPAPGLVEAMAGDVPADIPAARARSRHQPTPEGTGAWPGPRELILDLLAAAVPGGAAALPGPAGWIVEPTGQAGSVAPGNAPDAAAARSLRPGAACAVPLITGDAKLGAIGTVTYADGDLVLMMGHPFMQRGPVDWPLATARILTVFPSREMSFKIGSIGDIVGTVHHDQRAGLSGTLGQAPEMVPVSVALTYPEGAGPGSATYDYQVVSDVNLTPTLVFWSLYNSLLAQGDDASEQTLHYRIETLWEGTPEVAAEPLVLEGVAAGPGSAMKLASAWMAPLGLLLGNPFQEVALKGVKAELTLSRPESVATITGISGPRLLPATGGEVVFRVEVQPHLGESRTVEIPVTLPEQLAPGPYRVLAASSAELFAFEAQRASDRFEMSNLEAMLEILRTERSAGTLSVALLAPGNNLVLLGREMHGLPGSVAGLIRSGNMQAPQTMADYVARSDLPTEWALDGFAVRALRLSAASEPFKEERRP